MEISKVKKTIEEVARKNGVSVAEVCTEIQLAIDAGMSNPNPAVQVYWAKITSKGRKPTPEEVIVYMTEQVKKGAKK